jgi:hypothetical protein
VKRPWLLALIAANVAVLVGLAFAYPHLMVAPGPVSSGHAAIATDCFACHAPWRGAASAQCISCHAVAEIGVRTSKGVALAKPAAKAAFHQHLSAQDCMACHSDHAGPPLTHRGRKPFSHGVLVAAIRDRCEACHKAPADNLHRQAAGDCRQCHAQDRWKPATFEHDKFFVLDKDHNVGCVTCHAGNVYKNYSCYGCHEHTPERVRSQHHEERGRDLDDCVACHRSARGEHGEGGGRREGGGDGEHEGRRRH